MKPEQNKSDHGMGPSLNGLIQLEGPPVFLAGTPKSGKSALLEVFRRLNNFHVVDEPLSTWKIGAHSNEDDCRNADDATDEDIQSIREEVLRQCKAVRARRYIDGLSHHLLQIPYLKTVFPDARIVVLTRDPQYFLPEALYFWTLKPSILRTVRTRWRGLKLSTLPSLAQRFLSNVVSNRTQGRLNVWGAIVPGQEEFARTHSVVELAAYQWASLNEAALESAGNGDAVRFVAFEKLLSDPRGTLKELLHFCQIPETPEVLDFAAEVFDPNLCFPKRTELTDDQWRSAWPIVSQTAKRLGYDIPE